MSFIILVHGIFSPLKGHFGGSEKEIERNYVEDLEGIFVLMKRMEQRELERDEREMERDELLKRMQQAQMEMQQSQMERDEVLKLMQQAQTEMQQAQTEMQQSQADTKNEVRGMSFKLDTMIEAQKMVTTAQDKKIDGNDEKQSARITMVANRVEDKLDKDVLMAIPKWILKRVRKHFAK